MAIHVRTWPGSGTSRVTDMTNAGKRGKMCRVLCVRFISEDDWGKDCRSHAAQSDPAKVAAIHWSKQLMAHLGEAELHSGFDLCRQNVRAIIACARCDGAPKEEIQCFDEEVRGIDAPVVPLTAGIAGLWNAKADEDGICLTELNDPYNEWTELTRCSQRKTAAYRIARKVWDKVQAAKTRHEASRILRDAGAKLHSFCAVD